VRTARFHTQLISIKLLRRPQPPNTRNTATQVARRLPAYTEATELEELPLLDEPEESLYSNFRFPLPFLHD
jgi:hypothetical protein